MWGKIDIPGTTTVTFDDTKPFTWVVLGSSTAEGVGVPEAYNFISRAGEKLGVAPINLLDYVPPPIPIVTAAVLQGAQGGTTSATYMTPAKALAITTIKPTLVTHMVGSNDFAGDRSLPLSEALTKYKTQLSGVVGSFLASTPDTLHVLIHQQPRLDVFDPPRWAAYGQAMRDVSEALGDKVLFLDASAKFTAATGTLLFHSYVTADSIHLGRTGYRLLADIVGDFLGLPPTVKYTEVAFTESIAASGATTTRRTVATISIPPRPFVRQVMVHGTWYAELGSGVANLLVTATLGLQGPTYASRVQSGPAYNVPLYGRFTLPPLLDGQVAIDAEPTGGTSLYTTGNTGFAHAWATCVPI